MKRWRVASSEPVHLRRARRAGRGGVGGGARAARRGDAQVRVAGGRARDQVVEHRIVEAAPPVGGDRRDHGARRRRARRARRASRSARCPRGLAQPASVITTIDAIAMTKVVSVRRAERERRKLMCVRQLILPPCQRRVLAQARRTCRRRLVVGLGGAVALLLGVVEHAREHRLQGAPFLARKAGEVSFITCERTVGTCAAAFSPSGVSATARRAGRRSSARAGTGPWPRADRAGAYRPLRRSAARRQLGDGRRARSCAA